MFPKCLCTADLAICTALSAEVLTKWGGQMHNHFWKYRCVYESPHFFCLWKCKSDDFVSNFKNIRLNQVLRVYCKKVHTSSVST